MAKQQNESELIINELIKKYYFLITRIFEGKRKDIGRWMELGFDIMPIQETKLTAKYSFKDDFIQGTFKVDKNLIVYGMTLKKRKVDF
jgi:hypothetical protein